MLTDFATFRKERKPAAPEGGGFSAFREKKAAPPSTMAQPPVSFSVSGSTDPVLTKEEQEQRAATIGLGADLFGSMAKSIGQGIARGWAATGARIAQTGKLSDTDMVDPKTFFGVSPDAQRISEAIFGRAEPFNATSEDVEFLETFGTDPEIAAGTGGSLTMLLSALDVTGAGGAAKGLAGALRAVKAAKTAEEALEVARAIGLSDDIARQYADVFAAANTTEDAKKALEAAVKLQNTTKRTGAQPFGGFDDLSTKLIEKLKGRTTVSKQFISDLTNAPDLKQPERDLIRRVLGETGEPVAPELEILANEVRKYRTAEDFKRALKPSTWGNYETIEMDVPVSELVSAEPSTAARTVTQAGRKITEPVEVILNLHPNAAEENGRLVLLDGNHRRQQAILNGEKTIRARVGIDRSWVDDTGEQIVDETKPDTLADLYKLLDDSSQPIDVPEFAGRVKAALLPLKRIGHSRREGFSSGGSYEETVLPDELRGPVARYDEHVYESPIKTSAGTVHSGLPHSDSYFAHSRIEDLPAPGERRYLGDIAAGKKNYVRGADGFQNNGDTRRVIEIQSDLFQKGRLEKELGQVVYKGKRLDAAMSARPNEIVLWERSNLGEADEPYATISTAEYEKLRKARGEELKDLEPYRNIWWERIVREEVRQAAADGKTKLQFPTGETAMKIEGLGDDSRWVEVEVTDPPFFDEVGPLSKDNIEVGMEIVQRGGEDSLDTWIVTDVLADGRFKAVMKDVVDDAIRGGKAEDVNTAIDFIKKSPRADELETFDISGKIDTDNPIYRFYEKDVARYLKNKYGGKLITDPQGVKWMEVDIKPAMAKQPVEAFGAGAGFSQDEEGNFTFDPTMAAVGVAGFAAAKRIKGKGKDAPRVQVNIPEEYRAVYDDVESMERSARAWEAPVEETGPMPKRVKEVVDTADGRPVLPKKIEDVMTDEEKLRLEQLKNQKGFLEDIPDEEGPLLLGLYKGTFVSPDDVPLDELAARSGTKTKKYDKKWGVSMPGEVDKRFLGKDATQDIMGQEGYTGTHEIMEAAQATLDSYRARKAEIKQLSKEIRDMNKEAREKLKAAQASVRARVKNFTERKAIYEEVVRFVKEEGKARQEKVRMVEDFFKLDRDDMRELLKGERDVRLMTDGEFDDFLKRIQGKATEMYMRLEPMTELKATIFEKEFSKLENLRKVLKLPKIKNMSRKQLIDFNNTLKEFQTGDSFLGVRQLETVKNTDLGGIKTIREAREKLLGEVNARREKAGETPVTVEDLSNVKISEFDRMRGDTTLARQNPLYDLMVHEKNVAQLNADAAVFDVKDNIDKLIGAARSSRQRGFIDRAIPTDVMIFRWLEANDADKMRIAEDMTGEELEAAAYIRAWYAEARDYLVQHQVLKKFRNDYITHIRRGFLEAWKEEASSMRGMISGEKPGKVKTAGKGLLAAFKEIFEKYKQEAAVFNILDQQTDEILPLEKFFQFSLRRTDQLRPTQNVAKAFMSYVTAFEKKKALDAMVPKLDIYVHSLTPKKMTPKGLTFDASLKKFTREWINSKKGRVTDRAIIKPGTRLDWALRSGIAFTRLIDLGFSIPTGVAANFGAQSAVYTGLGEKAYAKGLARLATKEGREVVRKYRNFVGEPVKDKLSSAAGTLGDDVMTGVYGLFSFADRQARQVYLLGKMTDEEYAAGKVATDKLADLKTELGRHLPLENAESILGKTAIGKAVTQYKTWALVLLGSSANDLATISRLAKQGKFREVVKSKEGAELLRRSIVTAVVGASVYGILNDDTPTKDKNFVQKMAGKAAQDALSVVGALDPTVYTGEPRMLSFLDDLAEAVKDIVLFEQTAEGQLKGPPALGRVLIPSVVRQFVPPEEKRSSTKSSVRVPKVRVPKVKVPKVEL